MKKNKIVSLAVAGTLTVTALLAGTYAWQSISQQAVNENQAKLNPGARLHDDYNGTEGIKRVYVENYNDAVKDGDSPILVRVRLDEYMEVGAAAGKKDASDGTRKDVQKYPSDGEIDGVTTWATYIPQVENEDGSWNWKNDPASKFREHMDLTFGTTENVYYMPTFNKDHDSLDVDVNGTYLGTDGAYDTGTPFDDYEEWSEGDTATDYEIYDGDDDAEDNSGSKNSDETITHTAAVIEAEKSVVISMDQWAAEGKNQLGDFWIYDTSDGWAYWANPLYPGEVTGLLLSGNSLEFTPLDDWYYAMNVVGQFVTADNLGSEDEEIGFYSADAGAKPSDNAKILLNMLTSVTQKSMQEEVVSGKTVAITFEESGTETAGTVAIVAEEVADATGEATITDEAVLSLVSNENGVVTVKGHKPGVGTVIYVAADGTTSVARVTVDYATYTITKSQYTAGENNEYLIWSEDDTELTIEGYYSDYTVEEKGVWYQVAVGIDAFKDNNTLQSVTMKEGVKLVGPRTFMGCRNLSYVSLPESVTALPDSTFWQCASLSSIELPNTLTSMGASALRGTSLSELNIPEGVKSIAVNAIRDCRSLKSVYIPESVTKIGGSAFRDCINLSDVNIPQNMTEISDHIFYGCRSLNTIDIPKGVTSIKENAFGECVNLNNVVLPEGLTSVEAYAFYNAGFTSIELPASLSDIGDAAFSHLVKLEEIKVAEDHKYFCVGEDGALYDSGMARMVAYPLASISRTFDVPKSVTKLSKSIFASAVKLEEIKIFGEVTVIPHAAFRACTNLTTLTIPGSITSIEAYAFYDTNSLTTINFGGTVEQWEALLATADSTNDSVLHSTNLTVHCSDGKDFVYGQTNTETDEGTGTEQ